MTAPSNANTSGLAHFGWWVEHTVAEPMFIRPPAVCPAGENYTITPLVTAASAQARIAELDKEVERWISAYNAAHDQATENGGRANAARDRATAAEARADRLAKALETLEAERKRDGVNLAHLKRAVAVAYADMNRLQQETQP